MTTVAVLEDDQTLLDLYKDVIARVSYDVVGATSLEEILNYFAENQADLIIADLRLGATTAEETITALAKLRDETSIHVILISAQMMVYDEACRQAGFEHLLTKPFPNKVLLDKVAEILG